MKPNVTGAYLEDFHKRYREAEIFSALPETKFIPRYMRKHFADARVVLDLGFGAGLWFWASFLPALERLDGIDAAPEALDQAEELLGCDRVPSGFQLAHAQLDENFTLADLHALRAKRGFFFVQDYRARWPLEIETTRYDLVAEHGGGFAELETPNEFVALVRRAGAILKPGGRLLFVNFLMDKPGRPSALRRNPYLFVKAAERARLQMADYHVLTRPSDMPQLEALVYGFAQK